MMQQVQSTLPDNTDKTIAEIFSRWDWHGSYNMAQVASEGAFSINYLMEKTTAYNKLNGFYGFTGSFGIKLIWNSPPAYQGLFILAYVPPGVPIPKVPNITPGAANINAAAEVVFLSGCPHVTFNIAESTSAELIVPYVGPDSMIPTSGPSSLGIPLLGNFVLKHISPLRSVTTISELTYSVYFCVKDLRTYGNSPHSIVLAQAANYGQMYAQSGVVEALQKSKFISKAGSSIADFLGTAGKYVPESIVPSGHLKIAAWATGGAAKIADVLGFSKPRSVNALEPVVNISYNDVTVADATFTGALCAMNSDAGIGDVDLSGRGVDEMQISEIIARPNIIPFAIEGGVTLTKPWLAAHPRSQLLAEVLLSPYAFSYPTEGGTINTQMSYVGHMFRYWRGSFKIAMTPVCTKFHSGRIRVIYDPTYPGELNQSTAYSYTHFLDIRDASTWTLTIPYIHSAPWCSSNTTSGTLRFFVETPLLASNGVLDNIDLVFTVAGGPTFEFALPCNWRGVAPVFLQPNAFSSESGILAPVSTREQTFDMAPSMGSDSVAAHCLAIGDPVRSLRAVCKKFWISHKPVWPPEEQLLGQFPVPLVPDIRVLSQDVDMISFTAGLFAFWRGGYRVSAQNYLPCRLAVVNISGESGLIKGIKANGQFAFQPTYAETMFGFADTFAMVGTTEASKFEVPYTYTTMCRNTFMPFPATRSDRTMLFQYYLGNAGCILPRAMDDSFTMGTLIGAPMTYAIQPQ